MSAKQLMLPANRAFDTDGAPAIGAMAFLYQSGGTTPALFYEDVGLTVSLGSHITANEAGRFTPMPYQESTTAFRLVIEDAEGAVLDDIDPFYFGQTVYDVAGSVSAGTRTILAAIIGNSTTSVALTEAGREGIFFWSSANNSANVTADPQQGVYVAPATDTTGASGAWVRKLADPLRPEWFGAQSGNASFDNGTAFAALSVYLNAVGGGTIAFKPDVTYYVGGQTLVAGQQAVAGGYTFPPNHDYPINISGCTRGVVLNGNGSKIKCISGLKYGTFNDNGTPKASVAPYFLGGLATPYKYLIYVHGCSGGVHIQDLELDGNIAAAVIGGEYDDTGRQIAMVGIATDSNTCPVVIERVYSHHHGLDGIEAIWAGATEATPLYPLILRDSQFISNGRQGFSWVGGRGVYAFNCKFNDTGKNIGSLPYSAPGAGMDVEAEASICRDGYFENCEFSNNSGVGALHVNDVARITYNQCKLIGTTTHAVWGGTTPYLVYRDSLIVGSVVNVYANADPKLATKFYGCRFTADQSLSPTGTVYLYGGYLLNLGGGDLNVLFDSCTVDTNGNAAALAIFAGQSIYRNFVLNQSGTGTCYPRGTFIGDNTLTSAGFIDDGASVYYGRGSINGVERLRTVPGDLGAGTTGGGAFVERVFSVGPIADPGYITPASVNIKTWGASPQANVNFWNNGAIKAYIDADFNSGNMNFKGLDVSGGGTYNFYDKTLSNINFSISPAGNIVARGTAAASNLSGTNTGDQTITLTGAVTGTGTGSFVTALTASSVVAAIAGQAIAPASSAATGAITSSSATAGIGYATGAGGAVTQLTSKSTTTPAINKLCGQITMNNAALAAGAKVSFIVSNTSCAATDIPQVAVVSGGTANAYRASVTAVAASSFTVTVENITAGSLSEAPVIGFFINKAVIS